METLTLVLLAICVGLLALMNFLRTRADHDALYARAQWIMLVIAAVACVAAIICGTIYVSAGISPDHLQR